MIVNDMLLHEAELYKAIDYFGSQAALAVMIDVTQQQVSYWVQSNHFVQYDVAWAIVIASQGYISIDKLRPDREKLNRQLSQRLLNRILIDGGKRDPEVQINQIEIRTALREDLGDLEPLASHIECYGLLEPILISSELVLISGLRRLKACELLGHQQIPVRFLPEGSAFDRVRYFMGGEHKPLNIKECIKIGVVLDELTDPINV